MTSRAIVLARGLGRRMQQADESAVLTESQRRAADAGAKAMMPIRGRPFLDYVLHSLADAGIAHAAIVVAPAHEAIQRYYAETMPAERLTISFVVQQHALGTADAVLAAADWIAGEPFLSVNGDNLYPVDALRQLAALDEPGLVIFNRGELIRSGNFPEERMNSFALIDTDDRGYVTAVVEKPPAAPGANARHTAAIGMNSWRFDSRIFRYCREAPRSERGEFELPQAVNLAVRDGMRIRAIAAAGPVLDLSRRSDAAEVARRLSSGTPRP